MAMTAPLPGAPRRALDVPPAPERGAGESMVVFERRQFHEYVHWQHHDDVELTLVTEGRGMRGVGGSVEAYEEGDLCLIAEGTPHGWAEPAGHRVHAVVVHFPRSLIRLCESVPELGRVRALLEEARGGLLVSGRTRDAVAEEVVALSGESPRSFRRPLRLLGVLSALAEGARGDRRAIGATGTGGEAGALRSATADPRLMRVLDYVEGALADEVEHAEAAARAGFTASAFSRFFRRRTGRTFEEYVNEARVARACRGLLETDRPVTEIAFEAGFGSVAHFNRRFRRAKGVTPTAYRARAGLRAAGGQ
jgi:AraC-like DNA-binding protein/quercetin dioxygenase-like cupin family protein